MRSCHRARISRAETCNPSKARELPGSDGAEIDFVSIHGLYWPEAPKTLPQRRRRRESRTQSKSHVDIRSTSSCSFPRLRALPALRWIVEKYRERSFGELEFRHILANQLDGYAPLAPVLVAAVVLTGRISADAPKVISPQTAPTGHRSTELNCRQAV